MHCFTQTELQRSLHISHGNDLINWLENLIVIHIIIIVNTVNIKKYSEILWRLSYQKSSFKLNAVT